MQQSAADQCRHDPLAQEFFSQYFPQGFKVLFVGTDNVAQTLRRQLKPPYYHITHCHSGVLALQQLLDKDSSFDLVLSDVSLQDMDGYQFIRDQHLKTNIPHVVICGRESWSTIKKAFRLGACYILWEPVNDCEVRNLWQHVCRKREQHDHQPETDDFFNREVDEGSSSLVVSRDTSVKGENNSESMNNNHGDQRSPKKRRVVWSDGLHQKFLDAVNHIGLQKAVPRAILKRMNTTFLTRDNVASHLQKHRISLNKKGGGPQQQYQQHMNPIAPCNSSYGRFIGNKNISAQPVTCTVLHSPDVSVLQPPPPPPPQNPNNLGHLLEPSGNNSDPLIPPDEAFHWSEAHNDHLFYQLSVQQMQPQPPLEQDLSFAGGHQVVPLAMVPPSLPRYGSNMQQQFDENLASGSSHGGNMQITQNLTSGTQHLQSSQNLASGSFYENNMRHLDQNLALGFCHGDNIKQLDENLSSGSSHGGNMQITQNLTSGAQHLESSQNLASVSCYENNMKHLDQNLALGFCHGDNIKQLDENLASGSSHGGNMQITQNLTCGTQHLESSQNLASGSCYENNMRHLDQNLALGFCHGELDENLASGSSRGGILQRTTQNLTYDMQYLDLGSGSCHGGNMQQQHQDQNLASCSCYVTATTEGGNNNDLDGIIKTEAEIVIGDNDDGFCDNFGNHFDEANPDELIMAQFYMNPEENKGTGSSTSTPADQK